MTPDHKGQSGRRLTRRELLARTGGAALCGLTVLDAGCAEVRDQANQITGPLPVTHQPLPSQDLANSELLRTLNRVGYGPRPGDLHRIASMGAKAWIEEQLADNDTLKEDPAVAWRVNGLDTVQVAHESPDVMFSIEYEQLLKETQQAAVLRAVYSTHQLHEVLADFWTNHFNIYALKSDGQAMLPADTETVIRPHIWSFPAMLSASSRSPAMLNYLDNKLNQKGVANENYARELLELHTLGVHSGYTLDDIKAVARCFTGWTIKSGFQRGQFEYREDLHDPGDKFIPFLGLRIPQGGGKQDAERVLEALSTHPATARFIATKLCIKFLGTNPEPIVQKSAQAFLKSAGDIRASLRPILLDGLFDPTNTRPILKRPLDFVVGALRSMGADTDGGAAIQKHLAEMGQPLYQWPMPDGFPVTTAAWSATLLPRWNFATALSSNRIDGTSINPSALLSGVERSPAAMALSVLEVVHSMHPHEVRGGQDATVIANHVAKMSEHSIEQKVSEAMALALCSPAAQWK